MKLRHKTVLTIVVIFSCLSMFCIGFANWAIGQNSAYVTGTISAEEVKDYVEFLSVDGLEYGPAGFTGGEQYKNTMSLSYHFYYGNISNIFEAFNATVSLSLIDDITPVNNVLNSAYISIEAYASVDGADMNSVVGSAEYNGGTYNVTVSSDVLPKADFDLTIVYTIDFSAAPDASAEFAKYILQPYGTETAEAKSKQIGFKFSSTITEVES